MADATLTGRRALITGASRGIGAAVAERFAAEGAAVALVARTAERHDHLPGSLAATAARCRARGAATAVIATDLADEQQRQQLVADAADALAGPIDVLVNNAAAAIYQPLADYPLKRRRLTFEVNVHAPVDLLQAALPGMLAAHRGWVVNVSSATAAHQPGTAGLPPRRGGQNSTMGVYGASKAALDRLSFAFAQELWGTGVRVNCVAPQSAVLTEGAAAIMGDTLDPSRIEPVESMAEAILRLASGPEELTGGTWRSLDLLDHLGAEVYTLDGSTPYGMAR